MAEAWKTYADVAPSHRDAAWHSNLKEFEKQHEQLVQMYGPDTPFAPKPSLESLPEQPSPALEDDDDAETSPEKRSPGVDRDCPGHVFRFLSNRRGVWTVLQAGFWHNADFSSSRT